MVSTCKVHAPSYKALIDRQCQGIEKGPAHRACRKLRFCASVHLLAQA